MTAAVAIVPFVEKATRDGDDLAQLSAAFREGFASGSSVAAMSEAIAKANGVPWSTAAIDAWVFGISKKRRPFDPSNNPGMYGGLKNVGWACFAAGNVIKLPDVPRDGDVTLTTPTAVPPSSGISPLVVVGGFLLVGLVVMAAGGKKKSASTVP